MKLIRKLQSRRWPNGVVKPMGLFSCPFCVREVARPLYAGQRFKSCGCRQTPSGVGNPKYRHGASHKPIYGVWAGMMARCRDKSHKSYCDYGGRGIVVCVEWHTAAIFIKWALSSGYRAGLLIDRRDANGPYSPSNCRWLTPKQSARNKRVMKLNESLASTIRALCGEGVELSSLAQRFGVSKTMIRAVRDGKAWV